jgi:hypothetical protein
VRRRGAKRRDGQRAPNWKRVVELKVFPAFRTVDGKFGWFGEFGKCWVSNV